MDIVTQGILGATVAQSAAKKEHVRLATIIGFVAGMVADADVLIRSASDPLLSLEYHRHFTHSIFFIPFGALIAFILLWPFLRNRLAARFLYLYCLFGYLFSGLIDACTSYGTYLFWPVINERISWHIISIVDPIFTLLLLTALIVGLKRINSRYSRIGLALAAGYLLFASIQLNRAEDSMYQLVEERGHVIEKIIVKPTIGNTVLWRSVYLYDDIFYIDAVRVGLTKRIYSGIAIDKFSVSDMFPAIDTNSTLYNDIKRFEHFSDDFIIQYPGKPNIIGDVRYSMSPLSDIPLWGIEINLSEPNQHTKYEFYREASKEKDSNLLICYWVSLLDKNIKIWFLFLDLFEREIIKFWSKYAGIRK